MRNAILAALLSAIAAVPAQACTLRPPPVSEIVDKVAAEGLLIGGQFVQAFDPEKNLPEIIRAEQIFVGEGVPRDFVIYRSPQFFEQVRERRAQRLSPNRLSSPCPGPQTYGLGSFDRLVLLPAEPLIGSDGRGKWLIVFGGDSVSMGRGLDLLIEESEQKGRLQNRPPKSARWGDCMSCVSPDGR